jgi:hypothetical protein
MPYDDPDPTDPMTLHGVAFQSPDAGAMLDMVRCFIEEFARLGFDGERILRVFRTPGYVGPYGAYCELGEEAVRNLIDEEMQLRPHEVRSAPNTTACSADADLSLPVIQPEH